MDPASADSISHVRTKQLPSAAVLSTEYSSHNTQHTQQELLKPQSTLLNNILKKNTGQTPHLFFINIGSLHIFASHKTSEKSAKFILPDTFSNILNLLNGVKTLQAWNLQGPRNFK